MSALLVAAALGAAAAGAAELTVAPAEVAPGGVVRVAVSGQCGGARGRFGARALHFFDARTAGPGLSPAGAPAAGETGRRALRALAGVDLDEAPGQRAIVVRCGERILRGGVRVRARVFPVERLTVPDRYVEPSPADAARAARERDRLEALWAAVSPERLWDGRFERPAPGPTGTAFGLRRVLNGTPRAPHTGVDVKAPAGTPVAAANAGRVALAEALFFGGNTVVLDHGLGLYSAYLHLGEFRVADGERVVKGQVIGLVGATGRATGPHLHWSVRLGGARVDPAVLVAENFD